MVGFGPGLRERHGRASGSGSGLGLGFGRGLGVGCGSVMRRARTWRAGAGSSERLTAVRRHAICAGGGMTLPQPNQANQLPHHKHVAYRARAREARGGYAHPRCAASAASTKERGGRRAADRRGQGTSLCHRARGMLRSLCRGRTRGRARRVLRGGCSCGARNRNPGEERPQPARSVAGVSWSK